MPTLTEHLRQSSETLARMAAQAGPAEEMAEKICRALQAGQKVVMFGNGGSAADAQHLAAELAGRFALERPALAGIALTTNTSSITAIGNDYGYEFIFSRQLEGLGKKDDVLVAITTSGNSKNILEAVKAARKLGMTVVGMTGEKGGEFAKLCDIALVTPSDKTPRIQEGHIAMGHAMCEFAEHVLYGAK